MRLTRLREEEEDAMAEWCRVVCDGGADVEREREKGGLRVFEGLESARVLGAEIKAAIKSREFTYLMD